MDYRKEKGGWIQIASNPSTNVQETVHWHNSLVDLSNEFGK